MRKYQKSKYIFFIVEGVWGIFIIKTFLKYFYPPPGVNILHYSQILHLGKVSYFSELREEFFYIWVRALFFREKLGVLQSSNMIFWKLFPSISNLIVLGDISPPEIFPWLTSMVKVRVGKMSPLYRNYDFPVLKGEDFPL